MGVGGVELIVAGVAGHQVHEVHGAGPAGAVGQREGRVASFQQLVAHSFQLVDGFGDFYANLFKDGLVVEDITAGEAAKGDGQNLVLIGGLGNGSLDEGGMVVCIVHLGDVVDKTGLVILGHGAAAPVNVHIGALAGAHCNDKLLLVVVVLLMHNLNIDVGIVFHKTSNSAFRHGLARIFGRDVPEKNVQRLCRQLGKVLPIGLLASSVTCGRFASSFRAGIGCRGIAAASAGGRAVAVAVGAPCKDAHAHGQHQEQC